MKIKQEPSKTHPKRFAGGIVSMLDSKEVLTPKHLKSLAQLQNNERAGLNFESLNNSHLLCIRTNDKGRIILLIDRNKQGEPTCYVVALYDNHEYNRLDNINVDAIRQKIANNDIGPILNLEESTLEPEDEIITVLHQSTPNCWTAAPYLNQNLIVFSESQNALIKPRSLPLIVTGAAGSGKTLIILQKICDFVINNIDENNQLANPLLYCAPTQELAKEAKKLFIQLFQQQSSFLTEKLLSQISFLSIEEFCAANLEKDYTLSNRKDLFEWLSSGKSINDKYKSILSKPDLLIEEFKVLGGLASTDEYLELTDLQCLFHKKEDKRFCLELYYKYLESLKKNNKCQVLFPRLKPKMTYDMIFIDEAQSWPLKLLLNMFSFAINNQIMFFGDPLQELTETISIFAKLLNKVNALTMEKNEPLVRLHTTYRNSKPVVLLGDKLLKLRRHFRGGKLVDCEATILKKHEPLHPENEPLPIEWISDFKGQQTEIKQLLTRTGSMVITPDPESVKSLFEKTLVLSFESAQGLEAKLVLVYLPWPEQVLNALEKKLAALSRAQLPLKDNTNHPKNNNGTNEFTCFINRLFTAITRVDSQGRLLIYFGEGKYPKLCEYLQEEHTQRSKPSLKSIAAEKIVTTTEQDIEWIKNVVYPKDPKLAVSSFLEKIEPDKTKARARFAQLIEPNEAIVNTLFKSIQTPAASTVNTSKKIEKKKIPTPIQLSVEDQFAQNVLTDVSQTYLKSLFGFEDASNKLHFRYKQPDGKTDKTLLHLLLQSPQRCADLLKLLDEEPYHICHFTKNAELTLCIILIVLKDNPKNQHCVALLHHLITNDHRFTDALTVNNLAILLDAMLDETTIASTQIRLEIIYSLLLKNPNLFFELFTESTKPIEQIIWIKQLLKSELGRTILFALTRAWPAILDFEANPEMSELLGSMHTFDFASPSSPQTKTSEQEAVGFTNNSDETFYYGLPQWTESSGFFVNMKANPYIKYSAEHIDLIFLILHAKCDADFVSKLIKLFNHVDAERLLFECPDENNDPLIYEFMLNKEKQPFFIFVLEEHPEFCKLFTPARLNEAMVSDNSEVITVLHFLICHSHDKNILSILLKNNPALIKWIQDNDILYKPSHSIFSKAGIFSTSNLFQALCTASALHDCFQMLIQKEHLTPRLMSELLSLRFYNSSQEQFELFEYFLGNYPDIFKSWLELEPRLIKYLNLELLWQFTTGKPSPAPEPIESQSEFLNTQRIIDVFCLVIMSSKTNLSALDLNDLTQRYFRGYSLFHLFSMSELGQALISTVLAKETNLVIPSAVLNEQSSEKLNTIDHLIKSKSGIEMLNDTLGSIHGVRELAKGPFIGTETSKQREQFVILCRSVSGVYCLMLQNVLPHNPLKTISSSFFYSNSANYAYSPFVELIKIAGEQTCQSVALIQYIISLNSDLLGISAKEMSAMSATQRLLKASTIQLEQSWVQENFDVRILIQKFQRKIQPQLAPQATAESIEELRRSQLELKLLPHYNKEQLKRWISQKLNDGGGKPYEMIRFLKIICANEAYFQALEALFLEDMYSLTGSLLSSDIPFKFILQELDEQNTSIYVVGLFYTICAFAPLSIRTIENGSLTINILTALSSNSEGCNALSIMIRNNPALFSTFIDSLNAKNAKNNDWIFKLLRTIIGCQILVSLHELSSGALWTCIESSALMSHLKQPDQPPLLIPLVSTKSGRLAFNSLMKHHPEFEEAITDVHLTQVTDQPNLGEAADTDTLFWLCHDESKFKLLSRWKACGRISKATLERVMKVPEGYPLRTRLQIKHFIDNPKPPTFPYPMAQDNKSRIGGMYFIPNEDEKKLMESLKKNLKNDAACTRHLKEIITHPKAQSLLFSYTLDEEECLFQTLIDNPKALNHLIQILEYNPTLYKHLFTPEILLQLFPHKDFGYSSVIYFLHQINKRILNSIWTYNPSIKEKIISIILVSVHSADRSNENIASMISNHSESSKFFDAFNVAKLLKHNTFVADLFQIRISNLTDVTFSCSFMMLCLTYPVLILKWVNIEPRILRYVTLEHLFEYSSSLGMTFINKLASTDAGLHLLFKFLEVNPSLFSNISVEQLTNTKNGNSLLYILSASTLGYELLLAMFRLNPMLFALITPEDIMVKKSGNPSSPTIFELLAKGKNIDILCYLMMRIDFVTSVDKKILFSGDKPLIHKLCPTANGFLIFESAMIHDPNCMQFLTQSMLFQPSPYLPSSTFLIELSEAFSKKLIEVYYFIYRIALYNPSLLNTSYEAVSKKSPPEVYLDALNLSVTLNAQASSKIKTSIFEDLQKFGAKVSSKYKEIGFFKSVSTKPVVTTYVESLAEGLSNC